ncbi:hypothetical protein B0H19DRAFT_956897, partial [Mycena capillaripes]
LSSAPMQKRQTGDLDCNLARLKIVFDVAATQNDLATTSAVAVAQAGLQSVNSAIQDILGAVLNGQTAPANFRDQVSQGLDTALSALKLITE